METIATASPRQLARHAGGLHLINIVGGAFAVGVAPAMLVVAGSAAATANNVQANELLYRLSAVANLVVGLKNVPLAMIFGERPPAVFGVILDRVSEGRGVSCGGYASIKELG